MDDNTFNSIKQLIKQFNDSMKQHLPLLEIEVNALISAKPADANAIEHCLDTLLSLTMHGLADDLFIRLLEFYKTIDAAVAEFYWHEYDQED
jgi:hypothetical protein